MRTVLSADLGGTKCRLALVAEDFSVHGVRQFASSRELEPFLRDLDAAAKTLLQQLPAGLDAPVAIGVGLAGVVQAGGRVVSHTPNLDLADHPLAEHLERRTGLRTTLLNDGRASAFGEYMRGQAQGSDPLLCLFFGTGIGIGLMVGGRPYEGADNAAGEIGHLSFVDDGALCPCGGRGHFEAYCGGRSITERAARELGPPAGGGEWTVGELAQSHQPAALPILDDARRAAAMLVADACTLLNPRAVVLGGGVLEGWPALRPHLEAEVRRRCSPAVTRRLQFVASMAGSDAILIGAAAATLALWQR